MVGVALLGWAHIHTPGFARMLKAHQDIAVTGVYDHDRERAAKAAAEFGVPVFESPEAALADSRTDAVVIASETDRHGDLVFAAAAAGKAMFVEKPLGFSADSALQMADAVEKAGCIVEFSKQEQRDLIPWVTRHFAANKFLNIDSITD